MTEKIKAEFCGHREDGWFYCADFDSEDGYICCKKCLEEIMGEQIHVIDADWEQANPPRKDRFSKWVRKQKI